MNFKDAKDCLKQSGKSRADIKRIYQSHMARLPMNAPAALWNYAVTKALADAAGIPLAFSLKAGTANAVAEYMDMDR